MFLRRVLRPPVFEVDEHVAGSLTLLDDVVIMGRVHPDDWTLYDRFYDLARERRDSVSFVLTPPAEGATRSVLTCYNNPDDEMRETYELAAVDALTDFVALCEEPVIPDLTPQRRQRYCEVCPKLIVLSFKKVESC